MSPQNSNMEVLFPSQLGTSPSTSSSLSGSVDDGFFSSCRSNYVKSLDMRSQESKKDTAKRRSSLEGPICMIRTLLIHGGSGGASAAYCNDETLSSSFLILDGFLTISLGEFSPICEQRYNMMRDATERWGRRVETNVSIGKVSYEYRSEEEKEPMNVYMSTSKNASIVSQTLVKKPLNLEPGPTNGRELKMENYIPPSHKMVADCLKFQEYEEAVSVYEDILEIDEERYGKGDLVCAIDLHNLGVVSLLAGNLNEAIKFFEESILRKTECLGPDDFSISDSLVEIGMILYFKDDLQGALKRFEEALKIVSNDVSNSEKVGRISNNIACVYFSMDDLESATNYLQKAIVAQRITLGLNERAESALLNFALTQANVGHLALKKKQADAIAPLEESLLVLESVLGDDNMTVDSVRKNILVAKETM